MFLGYWWTLLHNVESVHGTRATSGIHLALLLPLIGSRHLWPGSGDPPPVLPGDPIQSLGIPAGPNVIKGGFASDAVVRKAP
jgi:hypothetical protein